MIVVNTVDARTHGRYLVRLPASPPPWPLLVGFHGYAETAADHLDALQTIPGTDSWLLVAVQALHPFYTRKERVVASWMTREDRELAIADNIDYVGRVLARVRADYKASHTLVFSGFSQGGAMAYRAAVNYPAVGVIILAADAPADVLTGGRGSLPPVLIGRGTRDEWYLDIAATAFRDQLSAIGVTDVHFELFDAGHGAIEYRYPLSLAYLAERLSPQQ